MSDKLGIYIHIPFCARKCAYCDFYSITDAGRISDYVSALIAQIKSKKAEAKNYTVDTVYIGGGTPSILPPELIVQLMDALRVNFKLTEDTEITIEANPGTLDGTKLSSYRSAGINRISMGLQSSDDEELKMLSRIHTREDFENSFLLARLEGFDNINIDIMYALPGQTEETLDRTLSYAFSLDPEHISFYGLKIEDNTPFANNKYISDMLPGEDEQFKMYMDSVKKLEKRNFKQYEISNVAKEGKECRHNLKYWKGEEYMGFGPAAYSFFGGKMYSYIKNVDKFIQNPTDEAGILETNYVPSQKELATQFVMVGFRLRSGIKTAEYNERYDDDFEFRYLEKMKPFLEKKFIIRTTDGYRLSRRGMMISNYILSEILDFKEK